MSRPPDRFPRARWLRKGYRRKQVEAFLTRVEATAQGAFPPVTAAEIRRTGFEMVRLGYDAAAVDVALDQLEETAMGRQADSSGRRVDPAGAALLRDELGAPHLQRAPRVRPLRRGYAVDAVDEFLDQVASALAGGPTVTLDDLRFVAFRPRRRGYDEAAIDDILDRVIELLLPTRTAAPGAPGGRADVRDTDHPGHQQPAPGAV